MLTIFLSRKAEAEAAKDAAGDQLGEILATPRGERDAAALDAARLTFDKVNGRAALYLRRGTLDECTTLAEAIKTLMREIADIKGYFAELIGPFDKRQPDEIKPFYAGYLAEAEAAFDLISDLNIVD